MAKIVRITFEIFLAALLGTAAIVIPVLLDPEAKYLQAVFLPFMGAVERMGVLSLITLTGVGVTLGRYGRAPYWLLGLSTVALLFVWSVIDQRMATAAGLDRHNLLPIEWFSYLVISIFPILGSRLGANWKRRRETENSDA
jgi:hypothetical protein